MLALFKKEINNFLNSLIGYLVIIVFLVIISLILWVFPGNYNLLHAGFASLDGLFVAAPFVFLFLIPAITMRFFADEIRSKTLEILLTKPLTDMEIILSKFFAGLTLVFLSLIPTLTFVVTLYHFGMPPGNLDLGGVWGSYLGLLFLGASFVSIGLFASALTENQVVAFIIAVFLCGFIYIGFELIYTLGLFGGADLFVRNLGMYAHYISMSRGVVDTRDVVYFISLTVFFVVLTKIRLQSRYW